VLVGGVDGIVVVDTAGTVELEVVVVVGLVISVNGFLRSPLPNGTFFRLLIGFCADIRVIWGGFSVVCAVLVIVGTIGVAWLMMMKMNCSFWNLFEIFCNNIIVALLSKRVRGAVSLMSCLTKLRENTE
jgi:hypothetical protein